MGNFFVDANDDPGMADFQCVQRGAVTHDLAMFIGSALDVQDRRAHEQAILRRYLQRLMDRGVTPPDFEEIWLGYRRHYVYSLFVWLSTPDGIQPLPHLIANVFRYGMAALDLETPRPPAIAPGWSHRDPVIETRKGPLAAQAEEPRMAEQAGGSFAGRRVLVTGAASGIGRTTALKVAERGGLVAALDMNAAGLAEVASECGAIPLPRRPDRSGRHHRGGGGGGQGTPAGRPRRHRQLRGPGHRRPADQADAWRPGPAPWR